MSDPTLIILPDRRHRGRPARYGAAATRRIEFVVTEDQRKDLEQMASRSGKPLATVIRDAVNEYVSDYGDRLVFTPRRRE